MVAWWTATVLCIGEGEKLRPGKVRKEAKLRVEEFTGCWGDEIISIIRYVHDHTSSIKCYDCCTP